MSHHYLPFEHKIKALDAHIEQMAAAHIMQAMLKEKRDQELKKLYSNLTGWETVLVARHKKRPQTPDYIPLLCDEFIELHGDRAFGDDRAIVTGLATIGEHNVMLIGQQKGRTTEECMKYNWGHGHPEGYRKALQKMKLAQKLQLPLVCLIDTKGAAPTDEAESRGISQSIAENLKFMSGYTSPIVAVVIGEGGSGGALGIGVADRLLMQEFSYLSVITPEAASSIMWKDGKHMMDAANALTITAPQLQKLNVITGIVPEPLGGAHRDPTTAAKNLETAICASLDTLVQMPQELLLEQRYKRLRKIGIYGETTQGNAHNLYKGEDGKTA